MVEAKELDTHQALLLLTCVDLATIESPPASVHILLSRDIVRQLGVLTCVVVLKKFGLISLCKFRPNNDVFCLAAPWRVFQGLGLLHLIVNKFFSLRKFIAKHWASRWWFRLRSLKMPRMWHRVSGHRLCLWSVCGFSSLSR